MAEDNNEIIIYQSEDGETHIDVKFTGETVWLSQQQMADLYQSSRSLFFDIRGPVCDMGLLKSGE